MVSEKQRAANRRNALKSTGPRTARGKARVSQNAMKHGLSAASHFVIDGEDPAEFVALEDALFAELDPQSVLEGELVKRIVSLLWRLRRVPEFEAALITHHEFQCRQHDFPILSFSEESVETEETDEEARRLDLGGVLSRLLAFGVTDKLGRYEAGLRAQLSKSLEELRALQAERQRGEALLIDHDPGPPVSRATD